MKMREVDQKMSRQRKLWGEAHVMWALKSGMLLNMWKGLRREFKKQGK